MHVEGSTTCRTRANGFVSARKHRDLHKIHQASYGPICMCLWLCKADQNQLRHGTDMGTMELRSTGLTCMGSNVPHPATPIWSDKEILQKRMEMQVQAGPGQGGLLCRPWQGMDDSSGQLGASPLFVSSRRPPCLHISCLRPKRLQLHVM